MNKEAANAQIAETFGDVEIAEDVRNRLVDFFNKAFKIGAKTQAASKPQSSTSTSASTPATDRASDEFFAQMSNFVKALTNNQPSGPVQFKCDAKFDGNSNSNPRAFIKDMELAFKIYNIKNPSTRAHLTIQRLEGMAKNWGQALMLQHEDNDDVECSPFLDWELFVLEFQSQFTPVLQSFNTMQSLINYKYDNKEPTKFVEAFQQLAFEYESVTRSESLISLMILALPSRARSTLLTPFPGSIGEALNRFLAHETGFAKNASIGSRREKNTMNIDPAPAKTKKPFAKPAKDKPTQGIPQMTDAIRETCIKDRLCYRCRQPGHIMSACPKFPSVNVADMGKAELEATDE